MGKQYNCELCQDRGTLPDFHSSGSVPCSCRDESKYVVICYMRVVPDNPEHMSFEQAKMEVEQQRLMQPEHIFRIEPVDPDEKMYGEIDQ